MKTGAAAYNGGKMRLIVFSIFGIKFEIIIKNKVKSELYNTSNYRMAADRAADRIGRRLAALLNSG